MSTNTNSHGDAAKYGIDLRLDAIDRALLGLLPRHDRIELVEQIESKLREVAEANPPLGAEPPEAMPDHSERFNGAAEAAVCSPTVRPSGLTRRTFSRRRPRSRLALSSGLLGIVALALLTTLPIVYFIVSMLDTSGSLTVWLVGGHVTAVALGGALAVALGIAALVVLSRQGGRLVGHGWAVTGLCTGPLPVLVGGLMALVIAVQISGTVSPAAVYTAGAPVYSSQPTGYPAPPTAAPPNLSYYSAGALPPGPVAPSYGDAPSTAPSVGPLPPPASQQSVNPYAADYSPASSSAPSTNPAPSAAPAPPPGAPGAAAPAGITQ